MGAHISDSRGERIWDSGCGWTRGAFLDTVLQGTVVDMAVFQFHFAVIKNTLTKATLRGEGIIQLPVSGCSLSLEEVMAGS